MNFFKFLGFAIVLTTCSCLRFHKKCALLPNGIYKLNYVGREDNSEIILEDDNFTLNCKNGRITKGKIKWYGDCIFVLEGFRNNDNVGNLSDKLNASFGPMCYELTSKNNTISFRTTHLGNLHITLDEGVILRSQ